MDNSRPEDLDLTLKCLKKEKLFCLSGIRLMVIMSPTGLPEKWKLQVAHQTPADASKHSLSILWAVMPSHHLTAALAYS